ncbi:MAG: sulfur carrier protein ThiS [Acidobacteriota bacterium]
MTIHLEVNGSRRETPEGTTVSQLLMALDLLPARVAVERNRQILKRALFPTTRLQEGDRLEIVQFVGGG